MKTFWDKVRVGDANACWPWVGGLNSQGYGSFWHRGSARGAHRVSYEFKNGPVPDGMQLDHVCRNRTCVNPAHLEPVTGVENTMRGNSPTAVNARKARCNAGHELNGSNVRIEKHPRGPARRCRTCENIKKKRHGAANTENGHATR